jgi:hypothetical protein
MRVVWKNRFRASSAQPCPKKDYYVIRSIPGLDKHTLSGLCHLFTIWFGYAPDYTSGTWREYHASPAMQMIEHTIIRAILIAFSDPVISDQSRFPFLSTNPMTRLIPVPAMAPREITIRIVNMPVIMMRPSSRLPIMGYKLTIINPCFRFRLSLSSGRFKQVSGTR